MKSLKLKVNEIFQSLQGEGAMSGTQVIFIRLSGCNMNCPFCDTKGHEVGNVYDVEQILEIIQGYNSKWIIWTGGEPTIQLTGSIVMYYKERGYKQAIETNGTNHTPAGIDYISLSPKTFLSNVRIKFFGIIVNEIRLPIQVGDSLPDLSLLPKANNYFVSPIFNKKDKIIRDNVDYCLSLIEKSPVWRLSIQIHKLLGLK